MTRFAVALGALAAVACSGDPAGPGVPDGDRSPGACTTAATLEVLDVPAKAGAIHWDPASASLLVVDDATFRLLAWREGEGAEVVAGIPALDGDPAGEALGEIAIGDDGAIWVPRFGYGGVSAGAVFRVAPGQPAERVGGLVAVSRRVALTSVGGKLLAAVDDPTSGGALVTRIDAAAGTETVVASGMGRAGGIARVGDVVLVLDPDAGALFRVDVTEGRLELVAGAMPALDRLARGDAGSAYATGYDTVSKRAVLGRLDATGAWSEIAELRSRARSVAADEQGRVFVSLRDGGAVAVVHVECAPQ